MVKKRIRKSMLKLNYQYEINDWGNKVYKSPLGNLISGIISIAITGAVLGCATESLRKSCILEPESNSQSGLNRKENQK